MQQAGSPDCFDVSASAPVPESSRDRGSAHGRIEKGTGLGEVCRVTGTAGLALLRISCNPHNCPRKVDAVFWHLIR